MRLTTAWLVVVTVLLTGLCACSVAAGAGAGGSTAGPSAAPATDAGEGLGGLPGACHLTGGGALPDPACTPGAVDPAVTQATISSTICVSGYTSRVRPPESYTEPLKRDLLARYGLPGPLSNYELDHLVPLEVGGAPRSVRNLWPEPASVHPGSLDKDRLENRLHDEVCSGQMRLADAQLAIATDWLQAWEQAGRP
ncbi:MAG TPA: hypothetical protein VKF59_10100 [Candidatus Dormibacteraeota bacterium]|nr:hypothetical protein [Candidatus Dormibacteraeota bacterium]